MENTKIKSFIWAAVVLFAAFFAMDLITDFREGTPLQHLLIEFTLFLLSCAGLSILTIDYFRTKNQKTITAAQLVDSNEKLKEFSRLNESLVHGLATAIERQFSEWKLSPSEKEIASLLIKGLSLKEISEIRKSSERTVRTQSTAIYEKSGVGGRAELSAYFLEDLLDRSLGSNQTTH